MANITITNNDLGGVVLRSPVFQDDTIAFAGADTFAAGTILARDSVSGKLVPFVKGGSTNENGIPKAILTYEVEASGAGDVAARVAVGGEFVKGRLVIDADGDDSKIDAVVRDQLRSYGMFAVDVEQLGSLDNQ